jgi:hypothetical protein
VIEVDLVDWTPASLKELRPDGQEKKAAEEAASAGRVLGFGDDALPPEPVEALVNKAQDVELSESRLVEDLPVLQSPEPVAAPLLETTEDNFLSSESPTSEAPGAGQSAIRFQFEPHAALKKAVLDPDIYTDKKDSSRAIDLRWILRDIRAKRTNWWPVSDRDLRVLIEMGLVEMRDDVPTLTSVGFDAVA